MKMLYKFFKTGDCYMLRSLLEKEGIDATVKNESVGALGVQVGGLQGYMEVWVNNDKDYQRAEEILREYLKPEPEASAKPSSWKCKKCGEIIQGQFTACWNCGKNKDDLE